LTYRHVITWAKCGENRFVVANDNRYHVKEYSNELFGLDTYEQSQKNIILSDTNTILRKDFHIYYILLVKKATEGGRVKLGSMTVKDLRKMCSSRNIKYSGLNKDELISALKVKAPTKRRSV